MKKTTTKIYRIRKGEKNLEIVGESIRSGSTLTETIFMVENGTKYKSSETRIIEGDTVSRSYFDKDGSLKWKDIFDYFENGGLKERKTVNSNGEITYFSRQILDQGGKLIFTDTSHDFSYHSHHIEKSNGKTISSQTTYSKGQPYMASSHRVTTSKGNLVETIKEYEELEDTEEGFYLSQDFVEYQFEYYSNGNKKRNIIHSFWRTNENGEDKTGRYLSKQEDFDMNGFLLKEIRENENQEISVLNTYEYEFNDTSDWIKRKCYHQGELFEIAEREIEEKTDEDKA